MGCLRAPRLRIKAPSASATRPIATETGVSQVGAYALEINILRDYGRARLACLAVRSFLAH